MNAAPELIPSALKMIAALAAVLGGLFVMVHLARRYLQRPGGPAKDRLVRVLVRGFHAWKEAVLGEERADGSASGRGAPPAPRLHAEAAGRTAVASAGSDGLRAYYMIPVEDLDDLKRLLQREIVHLRKEINELLRAR